MASPRSSSRRPTSWSDGIRRIRQSASTSRFEPVRRACGGGSGRTHRGELARREHAVHAVHETVRRRRRSGSRRAAGSRDARAEVEDEGRKAVHHAHRDARAVRGARRAAGRGGRRASRPTTGLRAAWNSPPPSLSARTPGASDASIGARVATRQRVHEARQRVPRRLLERRGSAAGGVRVVAAIARRAR